MNKNKAVAFSLIFIILFNLLPLSAFALEGTLPLPEVYNDLYPDVGSDTPIRPVHKYIYRQNPPSFLWKAIDGADAYDLVIYSDEALTKVYRRVDDIESNYFLFNEPFEAGNYYWWTFRYKNGEETSPWCIARRFKIASDAVENVLPAAEELIEKISGRHPVFFLTDETLSDFKTSIYENEYSYEYFKEKLIPNIDQKIAGGIIEEPIYSDGGTLTSSECRGIQYDMCTTIMHSALIYYLTGDTKYSDYAVRSLLEYFSWDWKNSTSAASFKFDDVAFLRALGMSALAYDWCYDMMTAAQRRYVAYALYEKALSAYDYVAGVLKKSPYSSHEWSGFQSFGMAFGVLLGTKSEAEAYFKDFYEILFSNFSPNSIEDGGYSKGISYWTEQFFRDNIFMEALSFSKVHNFYTIPFIENQYLWALYMYATVTSDTDSWGDSETGEGPRKESMTTGAARFGLLSDKPELFWWKNKIGTISQYGTYDAPLFINTDLEEGRAPLALPKDWHFKDQGMTAMHSDLINEPRISATFRSGMYGSYNHSHADQNSFMIESNGKHLAWRNGYYGYYGSEHHINFTRASHAHNTITYDNGIGQPSASFDFDADGTTTLFLSNNDMSAVVGDAVEAYKGGLDKFDRTFIYVRPNKYIVVDNLKTSASGGSTFEWWLNSAGTIDLHDDNRGAVITNDGEALDARIHYPLNTNAFYSNLFAGPDGVEVLPHSNVKNWTRQGRVWFQTEKLTKTKIIATMGVRSEQEAPVYAETELYSKYMKITFSDGSVAYISTLEDETQMVTADNFRFNGTGVVVNDDHIMFIGGTKFYIGGKLTIDASRPVAVTIGSDELGVSSGDDYDITLYYNDYMPAIDSIRFRNDEAPVEKGMGIETVIKSNLINIHADKGHYSLLLNDKPLPGDHIDEIWNYTLMVNGNTENRTTDYLYYCDDRFNTAGADLIDSSLLKEDVEYCVSDITGNITYMGELLKVGDIIYYSPGKALTFGEDNCTLSLESYENTTVAFNDIDASYVEFAKDETDGCVSARVRVTNSGEEPISARFILSAFDSEGNFLAMTKSKSLIVDSGGETHYRADFTIPPENAASYKAFLWRTGSVVPVVQLADSSAEAELAGIEIDGKAIKEFKQNVTSYNYEIPSGDTFLPVVKGIASDNAVYTTTTYTIADDKKSAVAEITLQNLFSQAETKIYTVNVTLPADNSSGTIIDHTSDFTTYFEGITADTYGGKVYSNGDETTDVSAEYPTPLVSEFKWVMNSDNRLTPFDGVKDQFDTIKDANNMRFYSDVDRITGLENSLYIRQSAFITVGTANNNSVLPAEIPKRAFSQAAFFGSRVYNYPAYNEKDEEDRLELYDCTGLGDVKWASFKVNKDCDIVIVSKSAIPANFLTDSKYGWKAASNVDKVAVELTRQRPIGTEVMNPVQTTYYVHSFKAGDTVTLYNANNGFSSVTDAQGAPSYHVFVRVK